MIISEPLQFTCYAKIQFSYPKELLESNLKLYFVPFIKTLRFFLS